MTAWTAVHVPVDTPTETAGWYVVGDKDSPRPIVLRVEGSDIEGERELLASRVAGMLTRCDQREPRLVARVWVVGDPEPDPRPKRLRDRFGRKWEWEDDDVPSHWDEFVAEMGPLTEILDDEEVR